MFERTAAVELAQLGQALEPPCQFGPYRVTSMLSQSRTALVFTAVGGPFGDEEGVLKVAPSHHGSQLRAEAERLVRCTDAGVRGVVWPVQQQRDVEWYSVSGLADAYVVALALPFLTGGDLFAVKRRRGDDISREVALVVGNTLRHLLELPEPMAHGSLSMRSVLLPRPAADLSELTLIDFGKAVDLATGGRAEAAAACRADVVAFGELLSQLGGDITGVARECRAGRYPSMADSRLWSALQPRRKWSWSWRR